MAWPFICSLSSSKDDVNDDDDVCECDEKSLSLVETVVADDGDDGNDVFVSYKVFSVEFDVLFSIDEFPNDKILKNSH